MNRISHASSGYNLGHNMKIAFLGIGLMGTPMVRNLAAAGHEMHIWNRSRDKAEILSDIATVHLSPTDAVQNVQIIISMLADGPVTTEVLFKQGVIEVAAEGSLIIDMGSVEPEVDLKLATFAKSINKRFLDAPVSGGVQGAEAATLTILIGGDNRDVEFARPVFEALGRPNLIGKNGAGQTAKLANQLIVAITIGAVAEAFKFAESAGCDAGKLREALMGGFADSKILELHGARMVRKDFEPGGRSWSQLKDITNALTLAQQAQLDLPLAQCVEHGFRSLVDDFQGGELDHSAYYLWLEKRGNPK